MVKKIPTHIVRLLVLLGFFLLLAFVAKIFLTDPSFYEYGHYRADAIPELAAGEPVYKGAAFCLECHKERTADWSTGTHVVVQCEVCHGIYRGCPENGKAMIPVDTIRLCTTCHEAMPARPDQQPQIVSAEHPFPDEAGEQCPACHDPHSPTEGRVPAEAPDAQGQAVTIAEPPAELVAVISKCSRCHGKQGQGRKKNPALAGMESAVFIEKMNEFKSGSSESKKMAKYAKSLSDEDIIELARYYGALPAVPPEPPPE